jgi:5-methylcytosine-specific restriction endonuclease McrA
MDAATSQLVRQRARYRCEYCRLAQEYSAVVFHVEHIRARQHSGSDDPRNLALACPECNYHKGTNLSGVDPDTGKVSRLFHPRRDRWENHFVREGARIVGKTPVGRTTVWLLEMNSDDRLNLRELLHRFGLLE